MENNQTAATPRWKFALKLAGAHLSVSLLVAALMAFVVFKLWYPYPYDQMIGGLDLYWMVVGIDVICGPLLMAVLASPKKSRRAMWTDFTLIFTIQLTALLYGLHTVSLARPVAVMFEKDRFVVVTAAQIPEQEADAPLSWSGAKRVYLPEPKTTEEKNRDIDLMMKGIEANSLPSRWQADNPAVRANITAVMQPVSLLNKTYPQQQEMIAKAVSQTSLPAEQLGFLPFTNERNRDWVVLLNRNADFVGYLPLDGFSAITLHQKEKH